MSFFEYPAVQIIAVLIIAYVLHHFGGILVGNFVHRILARHTFEIESDRGKHESTLKSIFQTVISIFVFLTAIIIILTILHVDLVEVATGAGFLGIVIGIGAQNTIRDYLSGIFILTENQYRVGDVVTLAGGGVGQETTGIIEEITLRITKLRDIDGTLHIVRNGEASVVTNRTFKYSSVVIDVGVAYDSDIDLVEKTMNDVGKAMLRDRKFAEAIMEPIQFFRVDAFHDHAISIKMLGKVIPAKQWEIAGEYRRRLIVAFRENDITIPFPQLIVHKPKSK